ncbi:D-Ala-D-Ala carboxypeptidase family metallohydrolase [Roseibium sp.]|uniref:D-Ala-D-Ala carboxypeptidase family metallohydrolase n=1 Tax=Roseibium sp. TaxID=1936156 RepID=UPI003A969EA7
MATPEAIIAELKDELTSVDKILAMQNEAKSKEELKVITNFGLTFADERLDEAIDGFRAGTRRFLNITERFQALIDDLDDVFVLKSPLREPDAAPVLSRLIDRISEALRLFHDDEGMRTTHTSNQEVEDIDNDEVDIAPVVTPVEIPEDAVPKEMLFAPATSTARGYEQIADEYVRFFLAAGYKNDRDALIKKQALQALKHKARYEAVGNPLGIPWWFVAGIHMLESSFNFTTHLHNGDPLKDRTFRVPSGRPKVWNPPNSWEASARDALQHHELAGLSDWSLPRALWRWERYNGWGYRKKRIPTPYLWSFSTIYAKGKFIGDGVFNRNAVSKQCGCATFLKYLHENGHVDLGLDVVAEDESGQSDADADATVVVEENQPNIDNNVPPSHPFQAFFQENLPDVRHFEWHEFLVRGGAHASNGLNTDPPPELWENILPLVRVLDSLREETGLPVVLTSVYRSPAYNKKIGGASRSQHMAFTAADFKVVGAAAGSTGDWAQKLNAMRAAGAFEGGIGVYRTFVHVDVRGTRADWDKR